MATTTQNTQTEPKTFTMEFSLKVQASSVDQAVDSAAIAKVYAALDCIQKEHPSVLLDFNCSNITRD